MIASRCQATNQQGKPCGAEPYRDGLCRWHHPSLEPQRKAWSAKGGSSRSNKARAKKSLPTELMDADELAAWLTVCLKQVMTGKMDPPVGTAAANLARTIAEIRRGAEIEGRMAEIERLLGSDRKPA